MKLIDTDYWGSGNIKERTIIISCRDILAPKMLKGNIGHWCILTTKHPFTCFSQQPLLCCVHLSRTTSPWLRAEACQSGLLIPLPQQWSSTRCWDWLEFWGKSSWSFLMSWDLRAHSLEVVLSYSKQRGAWGQQGGRLNQRMKKIFELQVQRCLKLQDFFFFFFTTFSF